MEKTEIKYRAGLNRSIGLKKVSILKFSIDPDEIGPRDTNQVFSRKFSTGPDWKRAIKPKKVSRLKFSTDPNRIGPRDIK
jgi:hypothetical protein